MPTYRYGYYGPSAAKLSQMCGVPVTAVNGPPAPPLFTVDRECAAEGKAVLDEQMAFDGYEFIEELSETPPGEG
ncbi:hypothetical protein [Sorangium sp. So ce1024]|uniref:hypothetical protein n=1 Tax=Sorangium sp. So ce1024 TaxID=3133327 RepID=UPI003F0A0BD3